jgi:two-component system, LuxR family, sensor kinase FixL
MDDPKSLYPGADAVLMLAALVESSDDAIFAKDLSGTILSWNRGAERMYGYAASEIVGRKVDILIPPGAPNELPEILDRIRRGERVDHYETVRRARDGTLLDVSLTVSPIFDSGGQIVGASAIARDVSERQDAERRIRSNEELLRSIVESAVDGIIVIDARGRIEAFNRAAEGFFGYSKAEALGQNVKLLMPSPFHEEHDQYIARYVETGEAQIIGKGREVTGQRKDGTTFPLHLSVGEMAVRGERKFIGILYDLTARVEMETRLREQAALVRLGEMAAVIAHEVKNPLAAVRGAIQVIGKRLPAGSREVPVISEIISRLDALNQLVGDLLLFARPPRPNPVPLDIKSVIAATVALVREDAAYEGLEVDLTGSAPPVMGDAELLKIVFLNLLLNSAYAVRGQGAIRIALSAPDGVCDIVIADTGPGIAAEVRAKLFTPFVTTKARGTGLGLSTVKRLLDAHHGSIELNCPPGGGTVVTIRLPLAGRGAAV